LVDQDRAPWPGELDLVAAEHITLVVAWIDARGVLSPCLAGHAKTEGSADRRKWQKLSHFHVGLPDFRRLDERDAETWACGE
jgi:hypothetical protein